MRNITVRDRQNMMDVAIQHSGSIEAAFDWAVLNNISVSDELGTGMKLMPGAITNTIMVSLFEAGSIVPATKDSGAAIQPGGINYMQIGTDFKVS